MTDTAHAYTLETPGIARLSFRLLRSIAAFVFVSLYVLIVGGPAILVAFLIGRSEYLFGLARFGVSTALRIVGIRYRIAGSENLRQSGVIYFANHQSNVDPPILFVALGMNVRMVYKSEFDKIPVLSHGMRLVRFVPIERRNRAQAMKSIERAAELVRQGLAFLVYPEGTRSRTGELLPFKKGAFIMAILAQAPVIPVTITGAREAMRKGSTVIHPVMVSVRIDKPIDTTGLTLDDRDRLIEIVRGRIEALIAEGPVGKQAPARSRVE